MIEDRFYFVFISLPGDPQVLRRRLNACGVHSAPHFDGDLREQLKQLDLLI